MTFSGLRWQQRGKQRLTGIIGGKKLVVSLGSEPPPSLTDFTRGEKKQNTSQAGHTAIDAGAEGRDAAAALAKRC